MSKIVNGLNYVGTDDNGIATDYVFKKIDIGAWDMTSTINVTVPHGLSSTEWKTVMNLTGMIFNDGDNAYVPISPVGSDFGPSTVTNYDCFITQIQSSFITVYTTGTTFNNTGYDSTTINRGFVSFNYKPD